MLPTAPASPLPTPGREWSGVSVGSRARSPSPVLGRFAPIVPGAVLGFDAGWGSRTDLQRDASPDAIRQLRSPVLLAAPLGPAPSSPFGMVGVSAVPAFAQHPLTAGLGLPVHAAQPLAVAAAGAPGAPASLAVPVAAATAPGTAVGRAEAVAAVGCSVQQSPVLQFATVSSPPQLARASRSGQRLACGLAGGQVEAELQGPLLQPPDLAGDECQDRPDRRPTDPFFYPTTISPLTGRGIGIAEQTTPQRRKPVADGGIVSPSGPSVSDGGLPAREESGVQHFAAPLPVINAFGNQADELRLLEQQNDALARHIQALEHAKSLAAVQSAQALHKIRTRQEQLKREANQAVQRAKAMQADFSPVALGTPPGPFQSGGYDGGGPPASPKPPQPPLQPPPTTLDAGAQFFHERRSLGSPGRSTPVVAEQPLWSQETWQSPPPPTARGLSPSQSEAGALELAGHGFTQSQQRLTHDTASIQTSEDAARAVSTAARPSPWSTAEQSASSLVLQSRGTSAVASAADAQLPMPPWLAPAPQAQPLVDPLPAPLPAADVPPTDIATMAKTILTAHNAPGHGPASTLPNGQPYVDALGNPLGPTSVLELPNIKDDVQPAAGLAEPRGRSDRHDPPEPAGTGARLLSRGADAQRELTPLQLPASARNPVAHERASVVVAHERVPASARASHGGTATPTAAERPERRAAPGSGAGGRGSSGRAGAAEGRGAGGTAVAGAGGDARAASPDGRASDAADAAAGGAVTPPSTPVPAAEGGQQRASRARQEVVGESPQREGRRRPSEEGGAQGSQPPAHSEQLQAELEECLDTIKWCASSVTRESLQDVLKSAKPAPVVKDVLEAVSLLLGQPESRWDRLKRLVSSAGFLEKVQRLNFQQNITREQFKKLRDRLGNPDFDEELIKTVCVPVVPLSMWCRAIGVYLSKTKFRGGPEIRPVASAGAAAPAPNQGERRPSATGAYMVFDPDIERMDPEELRHVRDLTISRPAVGKITFQGETDCTGLDFERIVRLEIGEVLVYPEPGMKPPIGQGLNKPATVTMYQCWPPNGSKLMQDPRGQERYKRKIQQMTEEKLATFIDYDCTTGVWKFSVDNF